MRRTSWVMSLEDPLLESQVFVASADVEDAFGCIRHEDVEIALLQKGVRPGAV